MELGTAGFRQFAIRRAIPFPGRARRVPAALLLAVLTAGCSSDSTGPGGAPGEVHFELLAGFGVTDTALHIPLQALVVEVRDEGGRAAVDAIVRFQSLPVSLDDPTPSMYVSELEGDDYSFRDWMADTVDSRGRAAARVRLGTRAGEGRIVVSAPRSGLTDTAFYGILPASPFDVDAEPEDTTFTLGSAFSLRAAVVDRHGNPRPEPVGFHVRGAAADIDAAGLVSARAVGRADIVARALELEGLEDTVRVAVVPVGTIAAFRMVTGGADTAAIVVRTLDASAPERIYFWLEGPPYWAPSGDRFVCVKQIVGPRLVVVQLDDGMRRLIVPGYGVTEEFWPQYSRDGAWVYYTGLGVGWEIWRVRSDGSGPERVGPEASSDVHPSPSPDGSKVVFARGSVYNGTLQILDLTSGTVQSLGLAGFSPRWSPLGELIAYMSDGAVFVVRPDGTGRRAVSPLDHGYEEGLDWSPDGRWIIARSYGRSRLEVIDVATGEAVPLPGSALLTYPSWRPQ
jgi:hypothetical protein